MTGSRRCKVDEGGKVFFFSFYEISSGKKNSAKKCEKATRRRGNGFSSRTFPSNIRWNERKWGRVARGDEIASQGEGNFFHSFFEEMENCNCNFSRFHAFVFPQQKTGKRRLSAFAGCWGIFSSPSSSLVCRLSILLSFPLRLIKKKSRQEDSWLKFDADRARLNSILSPHLIEPHDRPDHTGWRNHGDEPRIRLATTQSSEKYSFWWHSVRLPSRKLVFHNVIKFFSLLHLELCLLSDPSQAATAAAVETKKNQKLLLKPTDPASRYRFDGDHKADLIGEINWIYGNRGKKPSNNLCKLIFLPSWTSRRHAEDFLPFLIEANQICGRVGLIACARSLSTARFVASAFCSTDSAPDGSFTSQLN